MWAQQKRGRKQKEPSSGSDVLHRYGNGGAAGKSQDSEHITAENKIKKK